MSAYYFIKLMFHTFMTSQILLNNQAAFYFSLLKWQHNKALHPLMPLSSKYYLYCVPSRCSDISKEVGPLFWLLKEVYKWLSKEISQGWLTFTCPFLKHPVKQTLNITVVTIFTFRSSFILKKAFFFIPTTIAAINLFLLFALAVFSNLELNSLSTSNTPFLWICNMLKN